MVPEETKMDGWSSRANCEVEAEAQHDIKAVKSEEEEDDDDDEEEEEENLELKRANRHKRSAPFEDHISELKSRCQTEEDLRDIDQRTSAPVKERCGQTFGMLNSVIQLWRTRRQSRKWVQARMKSAKQYMTRVHWLIHCAVVSSNRWLK